MRKNYLVQPNMCQERAADYETQEYINSMFETIDEVKGGTNGNIGSSVFLNCKTKKVKIIERPNMFGDKGGYEKFIKKFCSLYEAISSALALYRLICIFPNPKFICLDGSNGYKIPWEMMLRHKETNEIIGFGEWKGGFNVRGTKNVNEYNQKTIDDFIKLLDLMFGKNSPHPYDNVTAGSVA